MPVQTHPQAHHSAALPAALVGPVALSGVSGGLTAVAQYQSLVGMSSGERDHTDRRHELRPDDEL